MKRSLLCLALVTLTACGPGLRRTFDDGGIEPEDAGTQPQSDAGTKDAGSTDAGLEDAGTTDGGAPQCTSPQQCPQPGTCTNGVCACTGGTHLCGDHCAADDSVTECGATCTACSAPDGGTAVCRQNACAVVCSYPLIPCGNECCGAVQVSAGFEHTCVLTTAGTVKCWGAWSAIGGFEDHLRPYDIPGFDAGVVSISAGNTHTCAVTDTGGVKCFGLNVNGSLGNGTQTPSSRPVDAIGLDHGVTNVSVGADHSCAVQDGGVLCWGSDNFGQLGDNSTTSRSVPDYVSGLLQGVRSVSAGWIHSCATLNDGGAVCWGGNLSGQCGDGTQTSPQELPVQVALDGGALAQVFGGFSHTCGLTPSGGVLCWGNNGDGQCGDNVLSGPRKTPVSVFGLPNGVSDLAVGSSADHSCAAVDGGAVCWGRNDMGQLGDTTVASPKRAPVPVFNLGPVRDISTGHSHTCAITRDGAVKCWGLNDRGQLGDGTKTDRWIPTDVQW